MNSDDEYHWSEVSKNTAAARIQALARGRSTRHGTSQQTVLRQLYDLLGGDKLSLKSLFKAYATNPTRCKYLVTMAGLSKEFRSPKSASKAFQKLKVCKAGYAGLLELMSSSRESQEALVLPSKQDSGSLDHVRNLYVNLPGSRKGLYSLYNLYMRNPDKAQSLLRSANLSMLCVPRRAVEALYSLQHEQCKPNRTESIDVSDTYSLEDRLRANSDTISMPSKKSRLITLSAYRSLASKETFYDRDSDNITKLFDEISHYGMNISKGGTSLIRQFQFHLAMAAGGEEFLLKVKSASMSCLLNPRTAAMAFDYLRSRQREMKNVDLSSKHICISVFRELEGKSFPPRDIKMSAIDKFISILSSVRSSSPPFSLASLCHAYFENENSDLMRKTLERAGLQVCFRSPLVAAKSFSDLRVLARLECLAFDTSDMRNLLKHLQTVQAATSVLVRYSRIVVPQFAKRRRAATQIQRSLRWKWKSLPWAICAIRIQRQWRYALHRARLKETRVFVISLVEDTLSQHYSSLSAMIWSTVLSEILDILFSTRALKMLDLIRDQRISIRIEDAAVAIQRWTRRQLVVHRICRWLNKFTSAASKIQRFWRKILFKMNCEQERLAASLHIQNWWRGQDLYIETMEKSQYAASCIIQALCRGAFIRHRIFQIKCFGWILPRLQAAVRGFLFRQTNPLGQYFYTHFQKYLKIVRRDAKVLRNIETIIPNKLNAVYDAVNRCKKANQSRYANLDSLKQRSKDFQENPESHLAMVERKLAKIAKQEDSRIIGQYRRGKHHLSSLPSPISPVKTPSASALNLIKRGATHVGVAYSTSEEALALEATLQAAKQVEAEVAMLQYQLRFLEDKFSSDSRKVNAELDSLVNSAQHDFAQRQLRHILTVSELKRIYKAQKEYKGGATDTRSFEATLGFEMRPQHSLPEDLTWSSSMIDKISTKGFSMSV